ncbi:uncharacterized protein KD926_005880 [Aspergillus affinis]|uniref:uncharacterized protein n=1 Tax=Aspergillus affinis TaxID=1070780 RepID=UPI0022FF38BE|nr:uncharacterized protein KD926_005880 [Aspergillus affinis]KAI9045936.1 hypothetical protein KD926_005880 [Aspergillus affinis]
MELAVPGGDLRRHIHTFIECLGAKWDTAKLKWEVRLRDTQTGMEYVRFASVFVSAVGAISFPRDIRFPGMEKFHEPMFHTARWDHSVSYKGKRVAVIGNGCSAAQVVSAIAKNAGFVKQYVRSDEWFRARPNHVYTEFEKFLFRWMPLRQRLLRLRIFLAADE